MLKSFISLAVASTLVSASIEQPNPRLKQSRLDTALAELAPKAAYLVASMPSSFKSLAIDSILSCCACLAFFKYSAVPDPASLSLSF